MTDNTTPSPQPPQISDADKRPMWHQLADVDTDNEFEAMLRSLIHRVEESGASELHTAIVIALSDARIEIKRRRLESLYVCADIEIETLERMLHEYGDKDWSHSSQKGLPGHCSVAQIWGSLGESIAYLDPTEDPKLATGRAKLIVAMRNHLPALLLRLEAAERELAERAKDDDDRQVHCGCCGITLVPLNGDEHEHSGLSHGDGEELALCGHCLHPEVIALESDNARLREALYEAHATLSNMWSDSEPDVRGYYTEVPQVLKNGATE